MIVTTRQIYSSKQFLTANRVVGMNMNDVPTHNPFRKILRNLFQKNLWFKDYLNNLKGILKLTVFEIHDTLWNSMYISTFIKCRKYFNIHETFMIWLKVCEINKQNSWKSIKPNQKCLALRIQIFKNWKMDRLSPYRYKTYYKRTNLEQLFAV